MKRIDLIRHLEANGCVLLREGGSHSVYLNRAARKTSTVPRHVRGPSSAPRPSWRTCTCRATPRIDSLSALRSRPAFLIVWLNAAAGLIGIEDDDPANLLYVGVLAIGFIGAIIARLQPRGLARALFATALAQALVGAIALKLPNTASV